MGARQSKSKSPKTVAVCGATGQQGGATVDALVKLGGFRIKAITRDTTSAKSQALAARDGVETVKADFDDLESLKAAFEGCDAVFAVTDFWAACAMDPAKELQQGKNLVDAAVATNVKHFVYSSLEDTRPLIGDALKPVNGDYTVPHFDAKGEVEKYMFEKLPKSSTALITSIFMQNLLPGGPMAPNKQEDGTYSMFMPCPGANKLSWCSTEDIGNVAAALIKQGPRRWGGKSTGVSGDHASLDDVAATLSKATGQTVKAASAPADVWVEAVQKFGMPQVAAQDMANMFVFYDKVGMLKLRPLAGTKKVFKGVLSVEQFVEKNKEAFVNALK
ncbi:hypothetical protein Ndes2526B_g03794 [Nannochloris sp. 'desiccata']|nr:hypothetical protein KSW81_005347 [Chlorella desiccata (nom. nud.)]KAH7621445.1 putative NmrA-like family domain-containing protein 1 [Chlorella desiccata (nom. nud.)]